MSTIWQIRQLVRELEGGAEVGCLPQQPRAMALAVASHLQDQFGLQQPQQVRLYPGKVTCYYRGEGAVPPGWLEGVLTVTGHGGLLIYVDCGFRAKFEVARPTARFHSFLHSQVPAVFVGGQHELHSAVDVVMEELEGSLRQSGLEQAPWRCRRLVKDMYDRCLELHVQSTSSSCSPWEKLEFEPRRADEVTEGGWQPEMVRRQCCCCLAAGAL